MDKQDIQIADVYMTMDDCLRYCNKQCQKYEYCAQCPGEKYAKETSNGNCELYFAKEYFKENNLKIISKED